MNTEYNKLIAEFMGLKFQAKEWYSINPDTAHFAVYANIAKDEPEEDLFRFHADWNWLMEVVEKIEGTLWKNQDNPEQLYSWTETPFLIKIMNHNAEICLDGCSDASKVRDTKDYSFYDIGSTSSKKESTYKVCVKFIQWYNQQPK